MVGRRKKCIGMWGDRTMGIKWKEMMKDEKKLLVWVSSYLRHGYSYGAIGKIFGVSGKTVTRLARKWGLRSKANLKGRPKSRVSLMREFLDEIGFWKKPYVIIDIVGQPHLSNQLIPRSVEIAESDLGEELMLRADRLTGEKVSAYVRVHHLEEQRMLLERE